MDEKVKIFDSKDELFVKAANYISDLINEFIRMSGKCTFVLSGGSTPRSLYEKLAEKIDVKWDKVYFFWGDERCVPQDNDESNYNMVRETLLSKINIPPNNIIRVMTEMPHSLVASDYEKRLRSMFPEEKYPSFDIVLLGLGEDGHTASLFPDTKALIEKEKWVVDNYVEKLRSWRITLTFPVLNNSKNVIFLVSGKNKSSAVEEIFKEKNTSLPAVHIIPKNGSKIWFLDKDASASIN